MVFVIEHDLRAARRRRCLLNTVRPSPVSLPVGVLSLRKHFTYVSVCLSTCVYFPIGEKLWLKKNPVLLRVYQKVSTPVA